MDKNLSKELMSMAAKSSIHNSREWLPFWVHSIDTAEILRKLTKRWLPLSVCRSLQRVSEEEIGRLAYFLGMTHDIGKLTALFQSRIAPSIEGQTSYLNKAGFDIRRAEDILGVKDASHPIAGEAVLLKYGCPPGIAAIVGSHHGKPESLSHKTNKLIEIYGQSFYNKQKEKWEAVWKEWINVSLRTSGYSSMQDLPALDQSTQVILTGLLITGDWLASNTDFFPLYDRGYGIFDRLYPARTEAAWEKMNFPDRWNPQSACMNKEIFHKSFGFIPNDVQRSVMEAAESITAPELMILEAQMGVGKTEAALAAAEIMAYKNGAGGLFFGLPSQATSNGLFPRVYTWSKNQSLGEKHTIELLHGSAFLNKEYMSLFEKVQGVGEDVKEDGIYINRWFDKGKTGLLADFTIGTVDQFLMAGLKKKHVMLRHLGLAGKVVIIDECHAYDAYMNYYLDRMLTWLGAYGTPVILLSATLPSERRKDLLWAYQKGKYGKYKKEEIEENTVGSYYPQITWTDGRQICQKAIPDRSTGKTVRIDNITEGQCMNYLKEHLSGGGCAGIIVNTVNKAQLLAKELQEKMTGHKVILYHSQFTSADRAVKEKQVLNAVGKKSRSKDRDGVIVVGTQVLEQSLDIDFDVLVTQLCPIDLLLQRIGRLHRHERKRPDTCRIPVCAILRPNDSDYDDGTGFIYSEWLLMRTKQALKDTIVISNDIPHLIEQVYAMPDKKDLDLDDISRMEKYKEEKRKKQGRAKSFCINEPVRYNPRFPKAGTIAGWLDLSISESMDAEATVRDGESSIEVILMVQKTSASVSFLPWEENRKEINTKKIPDKNDAAKIMSQRIRLPKKMNRCWYQVTEELKTVSGRELSAWQESSILKGQLFLLLDKELKAEVAGYLISYDKDMGLTVDSQEPDKSYTG